MKSRLYRQTLCIALALPISLAAWAAGPVAPGGLAAVVEQAWRLHPLAAGLDARDAEAHAAREMAEGLTPQPASLSLGSLNDRQGRNRGKQEWELEVAVPLWLPGQKAARGAEADSRLAEAVARRAAIRLDVAGEVRTAWWSLATARAAKALADRRLASARALADDVQKRYRVGELARIDANLARSEVLAAESAQVEADAAVARAEQGFRLLTGSVAPAQLGEEAVAAAAMETHPQRLAVAAAAHSARARVKLADESRRSAPELALRVVRERGDFAEAYASNVGVKLTIPFASGPQVRHASAAALAEAEQADAAMRRTDLGITLDAERAREELAAAERQLAMAQERRHLAADSLSLAEKAFALGESDLAGLLRIRAAAFAAENDLERQRLARAAAISRLNQALGVLP